MHFWGSFIFINGIFGPMFYQGLAGVSRRLYDGGMQYAHAKAAAQSTNPFMSISAWLLLVAQLPFILNFFKTHSMGRARWRESVGSDDARVGGSELASAQSRQLRSDAGRLPRAVRVQRARSAG